LGLTQGIYAGAKFELRVDIPQNYPFNPPKITFVTPIYHPNVDDKGNICIALLKPDNWKPAVSMETVLVSVTNLLSEPNPDDPMDTSIANEYLNNHAQFLANVKKWIDKYN
jgi:ubiquitin-protein ligase